jgi:hypothetical protein
MVSSTTLLPAAVRAFLQLGRVSTQKVAACARAAAP